MLDQPGAAARLIHSSEHRTSRGVKAGDPMRTPDASPTLGIGCLDAGPRAGASTMRRAGGSRFRQVHPFDGPKCRKLRLREDRVPWATPRGPLAPAFVLVQPLLRHGGMHEPARLRTRVFDSPQLARTIVTRRVRKGRASIGALCHGGCRTRKTRRPVSADYVFRASRPRPAR